MKVPEGMTEQQVIDTIDVVMGRLSKKMKFGYHEIEDIRQQGFQYALEILEKETYDPKKPLENFLQTHIKNQLINYKRNNFIRSEKPCAGCVFFDKSKAKSTKGEWCGAFDDPDSCKKYKGWRTRNDSKKSVMCPIDIDVVPNDTLVGENDVSSKASFNELKNTIDELLPADLRADYLRMLDGVSIPKSRREHVKAGVLQILHSKDKDKEGEV